MTDALSFILVVGGAAALLLSAFAVVEWINGDRISASRRRNIVRMAATSFFGLLALSGAFNALESLSERSFTTLTLQVCATVGWALLGLNFWTDGRLFARLFPHWKSG